MIPSAKNSINVLIGKSVARTASVQITDPSGSGYIADGEVLVLNHLDQPLTAGQTVSDSPYIRIVQRSGSQLIFSARIDGQNVKAYRGKSGVAGAEQIYVLGYNGSSGSIDLTTTAKILKISFKHDQRMWSEQPMRRAYPSSSTTQAGVATDIAGLMNQDSLAALMQTGEASASWISAEILCNNAGTAITGTGTITVRKGSKTITAGTDIDAVMAVGDYIRINSTATTGSMYKIVSMDTTAQTAVLNMPYQGASATVAEASNEYVTAANMATAACGIKMTGLPLTSGIPPYSMFEYMKVGFIVHPGDGFGSTTLTKTQESSLGNGTFEQVRQFTFMGIKYEGAQDHKVQPLPAALNRGDAVSGTLYDTLYISYADASDVSVISGTKPSDQELYIFLADGASQQGTLRGQLNPWMASTPKGLANVGAL